MFPFHRSGSDSSSDFHSLNVSASKYIYNFDLVIFFDGS